MLVTVLEDDSVGSAEKVSVDVAVVLRENVVFEEVTEDDFSVMLAEKLRVALFVKLVVRVLVLDKLDVGDLDCVSVALDVCVSDPLVVVREIVLDRV